MSFPDKDKRKKCWSARDAFWECMDKNNDNFASCDTERQCFEKECPNLWKPFPHWNVYRQIWRKPRIRNLSLEAFKDDQQSNSVSSQFNHLPDSDLYIRKLETRLSKVKGLEQNLTSKGMISVLQKARDDYMSRLMSSNQMTSLSADIDREVSVSYVEKKLFPEKIGVTYEELQHLLESDVLAKLSSENSSECLTDIPVDR